MMIPHPPSPRPRFSNANILLGLLIGMALFTLSLMVVGFGVASSIKSYVRSSAFQERITEKAGERMEAQPQFKEGTW